MSSGEMVMGLNHSPRVVTDGLVFYCDQNNIKSYKGPAVQNIAAAIGHANYTATGISITGGYETIDIPQLGQSNTTFSIIQNNYTSFTPNSGDCCPTPIGYGNGVAVTPSTLYTYAIVYKVESGYTNSNYMYRYEYASNGGAYVGEAGIHSESNRIHLGNGWYWAWGTFTTNALTNWLGYHGAFYYRYSNISDKFSVAKVLICKGDFTALHPKYWVDANTTRTASQAFLDLTGRRTVTITGTPTYATDGTFTFNSSGSTTFNLGPGTNFLPMPSFTFEAWIKTSGLGSGMTFNGIFGFTYGLRLGATTSGSIVFLVGNETTYFVNIESTGVNVNDNAWHHVVGVKNGDASATIYVDGVSRASATPTAGWNGTNPWASMDVQIGRDQNDSPYFFNGRIEAPKVYNRALTATEVKQNFNAKRGRYGL